MFLIEKLLYLPVLIGYTSTIPTCLLKFLPYGPQMASEVMVCNGESRQKPGLCPDYLAMDASINDLELIQGLHTNLCLSIHPIHPPTYLLHLQVYLCPFLGFQVSLPACLYLAGESATQFVLQRLRSEGRKGLGRVVPFW